MTFQKTAKKPALKPNETMRLHVTKDGKVIYVPMEFSFVKPMKGAR